MKEEELWRLGLLACEVYKLLIQTNDVFFFLPADGGTRHRPKTHIHKLAIINFTLHPNSIVKNHALKFALWQKNLKKKMHSSQRS